VAQFELRLRVEVEARDDVAVAAVIMFPSAMIALQVELELEVELDLQAPSLGFNLKPISASVTTNDDVLSSGCCPTPSQAAETQGGLFPAQRIPANAEHDRSDTRGVGRGCQVACEPEARVRVANYVLRT
jgi:hypothetical protein